jgi:hypothetical protein
MVTDAPKEKPWTLAGEKLSENIIGSEEVKPDPPKNNLSEPGADQTPPNPPNPPENPPINNLSDGEPPADPPKKISVDDLYEEIAEQTEADKAAETGNSIGPDGKPIPEEEKLLTGDELKEIAPGKSKLGKFTQEEFDETKIFVSIIHTGLLNGNAWLMQQVAGEGELSEYKSFDKQRFDVWTDLGTQLCAKYGFKPPLELSYMAASGANLSPAWALTFKLHREKKKNKQLEADKAELQMKLFLKENPEFVRKYAETGQVPPSPPKNYPTTSPDGAGEETETKEETNDDAEMTKEFLEADNWVLNEKTNWWHHKTEKDRKYPARDGDYIFSAEKGAMIQRTTGETKIGRPKGLKNSSPKKSAGIWKDPEHNGRFMSKSDIALAKKKGFTPKTIAPGWRKKHV